MVKTTRRKVLKVVGAAPLPTGSIDPISADARQTSASLEKLGHSLLANVEGGYAGAAIRSDGRYGLTGSYFGTGGSYLVDLQTPSQPTEVHRLPSSPVIRNADVKFDSRDGLYYRSQEPLKGDADIEGVAVIDYGFGDGTPENPVIISHLQAGPTHNLFPHPNESLVYAVNARKREFGIHIFDVSDPTNPTKEGAAGPPGSLHDVVLDPDTDLMHAAYIGGETEGYVLLDASDPRHPEEVGRVNYKEKPSYSSTGMVGFENAHYADYDPKREIGIVGDETRFGVPGGKHMFDLGWKDGAPENPKPLGFTRSPNAELMDSDPDNDGEVEQWEAFDWTTHNHDVISKSDQSFLLSGDYREGVVLYDITRPTNPTALDRYPTDDQADAANGPIAHFGNPPFCWGINYSTERDLGFATDLITGVYTFRVNV